MSPNAQLQAMIDQGVIAALAARDANRNGDDSRTSGTGARRTERVTRECTYQDFMKCHLCISMALREWVELTNGLEGGDCIPHKQMLCGKSDQLLRKKMTDKYCSRNEIKKLETELWNLKVKGTDVTGYNQRFQELELLCVRMFPEESDKVERLDPLLTKLEFPQELSKVHNTFHVSNLKKYYANEPLAVPLDRLHFDDKLHFVEEPIEIIDREVKRLKRSRIPLDKVRWNSKRGPEFTWEREDQFKEKYPHLFTKTTPSSSAIS
ncbi:hypothetical protein Tco_0086120 [Tanacetum coccineum]